jgi:hypothetical protein
MKHRAVEASLPNNEPARDDVDLGTENSHARVKYGYSDNKLQCWIHVFLAALIGTSLRLTVFPEAVSIYTRVHLQDVARATVSFICVYVFESVHSQTTNTLLITKTGSTTACNPGDSTPNSYVMLSQALAEELGGGFYKSQTAFLCTFGEGFCFVAPPVHVLSTSLSSVNRSD